jgi:pimeloyl-ACP methyl ester carboxylesterase
MKPNLSFLSSLSLTLSVVAYGAEPQLDWLNTPAGIPCRPIVALLQGRTGKEAEAAKQRIKDLEQRVAQGEKLPTSLRGWVEWAYTSPVDGSPQPFAVGVPENYEAGRRYPLVIMLHGSGGTHLDYHGQLPTDHLVLHVLGYSKKANYRGIGEQDVLSALDEVEKAWSIDPERIHLQGHSIGGQGAFTLASRHPDWFASVAPCAGWSINTTPENWGPCPVLALTSRDDRECSRLARYGLVAAWADGGTPSLWLFEGRGHWWEPKDVPPLNAWRMGRTRPPAPTHWQYVAEDSVSNGAWYVHIRTWGFEATPPRFKVNVDERQIAITTRNIAALTVNPASIPGTATLPLVVDGCELGSVERGDESIDLVRTGTAWQRGAFPSGRSHGTGGIDALFHGEPYAVVVGTLGDAAAVARRETLARHLARYAGGAVAIWDERETGAAPVFHDTDALNAPEALAGRNLILIGRPEEFRGLERFTGGMPAQITNDTVISGTQSWPLAERTAGILGLRADEPARLVYWLGSVGETGYAVGNLPWRKTGCNDSRQRSTPDLWIVGHHGNRLVAARRLAGDWTWTHSPVSNAVLNDPSVAGCANIVAKAIAGAVPCDLALAPVLEKEKGFRVYPDAEPGVTTVEDLAALRWGERVLLLEPTGAQLQTALKDSETRFVSAGISTENLVPERRYRVAIEAPFAWPLLRLIPDPDLPGILLPTLESVVTRF